MIEDDLFLYVILTLNILLIPDQKIVIVTFIKIDKYRWLQLICYPNPLEYNVSLLHEH